MVLIPLHATPADQPPPLTPTRLLTEWTWEWSMGLGIAIAAGLYIAGLVVLQRRGDRWPAARGVSFLLGGLGSIAVAQPAEGAARGSSTRSIGSADAACRVGARRPCR
jgi:hypothetical protein